MKTYKVLVELRNFLYQYRTVDIEVKRSTEPDEIACEKAWHNDKRRKSRDYSNWKFSKKLIVIN